MIINSLVQIRTWEINLFYFVSLKSIKKLDLFREGEFSPPKLFLKYSINSLDFSFFF